MRQVHLLLALVVLSAISGRAIAVPSGYDLVFADEFNVSWVDGQKWATNYPWGNYHNHNAVVSASQVSTQDGALVLHAEHGAPGWAKETHTHDNVTRSIDFTSGAVHTNNKFGFEHGYVEARMKMPSTRGSWPAFWTLQPGGWPPEIDIMEFPLTNNDQKWRYWWNYHYGNDWRDHQSFGGEKWQGADLTAGWHTYGVEWTPSALKFYFDGQVVAQVTNANALSHLDRENYLLLNYAVGGWPGYPPNASNFDDEFEIDWVRVWQSSEARDTRLVDPQANSYAEWDWDGSWTNGAPTQGDQVARFGSQDSANQTLEWDGVKNTGSVYFDGDTAFTLGDGDGDESLMLAMASGNAWGQFSVTGGNASHTVNSRLEVWSNYVFANERSGRVTFNGNLISQAREGAGGHLTFAGLEGDGNTGDFVINGQFYLQRRTRLRDNAHVTVNGGLFGQDNLYDEAVLEVLSGSTLVLDGLNALDASGEGAGDTSLGYLGPGSDKLLLDDGTLVLRGATDSSRGFTIGAGGATLVADAGASVVLRNARTGGQEVVSSDGGDLTLGGAGTGRFDKSLTGSGGPRKTGVGEWTINGVNTFTGRTTVEQGTLIVHGAVGSGDTTVLSGAALAGSGTIGGGLHVSGRVAPIDDLDVQGETTLAADSTLSIEIENTTAAGELRILDQATLELGSSLEVTLASDYAPSEGDVFQVLTAFGGLTGQFSTLLLPDLSRLDWEIAYDTQSVTLSVVAAGLTGDYNDDGIVNAADYAVWRGNLGATLPNAPPSGQHHDAWRRHFGQTAPASRGEAITVPEPLAGIVMTIAMAALGVTCRPLRP